MHSGEFFLFKHFAGKNDAELTADIESVQACGAYQQKFQILAAGMILMTFVRFMDCVRYEGKMGLITSMLVESASAVLHLLIFLAFFLGRDGCCLLFRVWLRQHAFLYYSPVLPC